MHQPDPLWAIVRTSPTAQAEVLAVLADGPTARSVAEELGPGHHATPTTVVAADAAVQVVHAWSCRATVTGGVVRVDEPQRLAGASRLALPGEPAPVIVDTVNEDQAAAELDAAVFGRPVRHVQALAHTAERARELAAGRAQELADEA